MKLRLCASRLLTMESSLSIQRAQLLHHFIAHDGTFSTITKEQDSDALSSMMEQYGCDEGDYRMELETFWELMQNAANILNEDEPAPDRIETADIHSNGFVESTPETDAKNTQCFSYTQEESAELNASTLPSYTEYTECPVSDSVDNRSVAGSHVTGSHITGVLEPAQPMMHRKGEEMTKADTNTTSQYMQNAAIISNGNEAASDHIETEDVHCNHFLPSTPGTDAQTTQCCSYTQEESDELNTSTLRPYTEYTECSVTNSVHSVPDVTKVMTTNDTNATSQYMAAVTPMSAIQHRKPVKVRVLLGGSVTAQSEESTQVKSLNTQSVSEVEEFPALVSVPPRPAFSGILYHKRGLTTSVKNNMVNTGYKYGGRGFSIWKQHCGRAIYTCTELNCAKTFGGDVDKLKRFFVERGGFKKDQIRMVRVFGSNSVNVGTTSKDENGVKMYARIYVIGSMENIKSSIKNMNPEDGKQSVSIYKLRRNNRSRKLVVRNFDILSKDDHRKFTKLFLKFGQLETDVAMGRNRNGVNYALVTYRSIEDARSCERNQNDQKFRKYRYGNRLVFNGRNLMIGYVNEEKEANSKKGRRQ